MGIHKVHKNIYSNPVEPETFAKQASLYVSIKDLVVGQIGMQCGGMDFGAFSGIPTINIIDDLSNKRMQDLKQVFYVTANISRGAGYDSSNNTPFSANVLDKIITAARAFT